MPQMQPVPGVVKVRVGFTIGTDVTTGSHVFVSYGTVTPSAAQLTTMANSIANAWTPNLGAQTHSSTLLTNITCTDLSASNAAIGQWNGSTPGTLGGQPLPANTCALVNFTVARRYRGGKPRVYWPAGTAANLANSQTWAAAFVTSFNTAWNAWLAAVIAATNVWGTGAAIVNVSYYLKGEWKPDHLGNYHRIPTARVPPLVETATSKGINVLVGSQRRRVRSV